MLTDSVLSETVGPSLIAIDTKSPVRQYTIADAIAIDRQANNIKLLATQIATDAKDESSYPVDFQNTPKVKRNPTLKEAKDVQVNESHESQRKTYASTAKPTNMRSEAPLLQQGSKGMLISRQSFTNRCILRAHEPQTNPPSALPPIRQDVSLREHHSISQAQEPTHYLTLQVKQVLDLSIREGKSRSSQAPLDPEQINACVKIGERAVTVVGVFPTISCEKICSYVTLGMILTVEINIIHVENSNGGSGFISGLKRLTVSKTNSESQKEKRRRRTVKGRVSVPIAGIIARSDANGVFTLALSNSDMPEAQPFKRHSSLSNSESESMVAMISMKATIHELEVEEEIVAPEEGWITLRVSDAALWSTFYAVVKSPVIEFYSDDINLPNKPKKKMTLDVSKYIAAIQIEKSTCIKNGFRLLPRPDCDSREIGCVGPLEFRAESKREKQEWQLCFQNILRECNEI
eukprot:CFRG5693T1